MCLYLLSLPSPSLPTPLRASRILKRWRTRISISQGMLAIVRNLLVIVFSVHWFACVWTLQTTFASSRSATWLGSYGLCSTTETSPSGESVCAGEWDVYFASLYFAMYTVTSVCAGPPCLLPRPGHHPLAELLLTPRTSWGAFDTSQTALAQPLSQNAAASRCR